LLQKFSGIRIVFDDEYVHGSLRLFGSASCFPGRPFFTQAVTRM
jgi:hypothetical protein